MYVVRKEDETEPTSLIENTRCHSEGFVLNIPQNRETRVQKEANNCKAKLVKIFGLCHRLKTLVLNICIGKWTDKPILFCSFIIEIFIINN